MEKIEITESACTSCGICAKNCPLDVIVYDEAGHPRMRADGADCIACGHCAAVCPSGAITSMLDTPAAEAEESDTLALLKNRRSCRSYSNKKVPWELIERALDVARYAPSAKNTQPVEWAVITDERLIRDLAGRILSKMREKPELAHRYAFVERDEDPIYKGAPVLVAVHSDPKNVLWAGDGIIAATYFDIAAQSLGLGTCWSGTAFSAASAIKEAARIPAENNLHAVIMLGFPATRWHRIPARKSLRATRV